MTDTKPTLKIDRTVPVSREDYDRMADQRDRFRAALVEASTYFTGVLRNLEEVDAALEVLTADAPPDREDVVRDAIYGLECSERCALEGWKLVKKELKP